MIPDDEALRRALRNATLAAKSYMAKSDAAGDVWHEETVTDLVVNEAHPVVKYAKFTRRQEAEVGADWLWWWLDDDGFAFGMLIQAKRLRRSSTRWTIDFNYHKGSQRRQLIQTGLELRVPPMYALYLGTPKWRDGALCGAPVHLNDCEWCERSIVSIAPAIVLAAAVGDEGQEVSLMLDAALPLETIADPEVTVERVFDRNLATLSPEVSEFLNTPQLGAKRVAQLVFERVTELRMLQHSGPSGTVTDRGTEPLFRALPDDVGHFGRAYYPEILDGLRERAPDYVLDVLADQPVPEEIATKVAGVVVFRC